MVCRSMWTLGWAAANDGNVSMKLENGSILATPTGVSKGMVTPAMLVLIDSDGNPLEGSGTLRPSSEIKLHLRCYKEREDVGAVVHAHPPTATGFAVSHVPLDCSTMIETIISVGEVPLTPYATPSTEEVPNAVAPFLKDHNVLLMANHGALTIGKDLMSAYYRMETLEHFAKISLTAHLLGGAKPIPEERIKQLNTLLGR